MELMQITYHSHINTKHKFQEYYSMASASAIKLALKTLVMILKYKQIKKQNNSNMSTHFTQNCDSAFSTSMHV